MPEIMQGDVRALLSALVPEIKPLLMPEDDVEFHSLLALLDDGLLGLIRLNLRPHGNDDVLSRAYASVEILLRYGSWEDGLRPMAHNYMGPRLYRDRATHRLDLMRPWLRSYASTEQLKIAEGGSPPDPEFT